jgi:hypothetical protein
MIWSHVIFSVPTRSTCGRPETVKIHVFLNFTINDVISQTTSSVKSKEGTCAVILHSVLAPADTCSTRGVRLKFDARQLGIQIERPKPHNCYGKNQNNEKMIKWLGENVRTVLL